MVTIEELFKETVHLCGSTDMDEYMDFSITTFNMLMVDCFNENNHMRLINGKEKLNTAPRIENLSEQLPCEEQLRAALPYGWAAKLLIASDDMDEGKHTIYLQMFNNSLASLTNKAVEESVEDVYAEY